MYLPSAASNLQPIRTAKWYVVSLPAIPFSRTHTLKTTQTFHTDLGDLVSLFTLDRGRGGGTFRLASSGQIYNVLAKNRPDVLQTLSEDFVFDTQVPNYPFPSTNSL